MPEAFWSGKHSALRRALGSAACLLLLWLSEAAADCAPEPQGEGRIASVIDSRTLRLDDGRIVRLSGLAPLDGAAEPFARAALERMARGRAVSLLGESDVPDRYGRQHAWVFAEGREMSMQAAMVGAGVGLRHVPISEADCRRELESAERMARTSRSGLWGLPGPIKNAESPDDISDEIGHFRVIEGRVRSVRASGGVNYLNFGRRWAEGFAVMVPKRAESAFEAAGMSLKTLEGQQLRVRGYVMRRSGPRIEAVGPEQIEVVGGGEVVTKETRN